MRGSGIDPVINTELRMRLVAALYGVSNTSFEDLRSALKITAPHLSKNLKVLEESDYVLLMKLRKGRRWETRITLTETGEARYLSFRAELLSILNP